MAAAWTPPSLEMGSWVHCVLLIVVLFINKANGQIVIEKCDFFQGSWVLDATYPLYNTTSCPFIQREFNCEKNGRPDQTYLKYKWQPHGCNLARYGFLSGEVFFFFIYRTESIDKLYIF